MEKVALVYFVLGFVTLSIGTYRQVNQKQNLESGPLDSLAWFFVWFIYLPTFLFLYVKNKIKGKSI